MARKAKSEADTFRALYPDLPTSDDNQEPDTKQQEPDQVAELRAKLAALEGKLEQANKTNLSLMSSPAPSPTTITAPVFDKSKMPDPVEKPDEYAAYVDKMVQERVDYEKRAYQAQQQNQAQLSQRANMLWEAFAENYKEHASNQDKVEIAAGRVLQKAQAMGVNPDKYMYENADKFMKDVVGEMDKLFGKPTAVQTNTDDDDDDDDDRTGGIFTGTNDGGRPVNTQQRKPPEKYGSMSKEILAWQEKYGFRR